MAFRLQDFECMDCEAVTEILLDNSEQEEDLKCEKCDSSNLKRKISIGSGKGGHISWSKWRAQQ